MGGHRFEFCTKNAMKKGGWALADGSPPQKKSYFSDFFIFIFAEC